MRLRAPLTRRVAAALSLGMGLALAACGDAQEEPTAPAEASAYAADAPAVILVHDGVRIGTVEPARLVRRTPLTALLPEGLRDPTTWLALEGRTTDGRTLRLERPATSYQGAEAFLYLEEDGWPALALWRPDDPSLPAHVRAVLREPLIRFVRVGLVEIRTTERPPPPSPATDLVIEVQGEAERPLLAEDLAGIERPAREADGERAGGMAGAGQGGRRRQGGRDRHAESAWPLAAVVALARDPAKVSRVRLLTADGRALDVDGDVLRAHGGTGVRLRRNRRGEMIATVGAGEDDTPAQELRGVQRIVVVP